MTLGIGALPSPAPQRVPEARRAVGRNAARTQAKASEHYELVVEQKHRARQFAAGEQTASTNQALEAFLV